MAAANLPTSLVCVGCAGAGFLQGSSSQDFFANVATGLRAVCRPGPLSLRGASLPRNSVPAGQEPGLEEALRPQRQQSAWHETDLGQTTTIQRGGESSCTLVST